MVRVGLLWHSLDAGNLGLRALTLSHLHLLDAAAAKAGVTVEASLFGQPPWEGLRPSSYCGQRVTVAGRTALKARAMTIGAAALRRRFRSLDLLLDVSEGDGFTDLYGTRRLLKQLAGKWLALGCGRPLILAPQTIGPFSSRVGETLARTVLRGAAMVFVRDGASAGYAHRLGARREIREVTDLAFALPYDRTEQRSASVRVGINPSGLLFGGAPGAFALRVSYPELIQGLIDTFASLPGVELVLLPHVCSQPGMLDDDVECCRALAARYPGVQIAPAFADPRNAKSFISTLDFFVGTRLHACIAAFSSGVPLLPLAYSPKTTAVFRSLGYPVAADMTRASVEATMALARDAFSRRSELRVTVDAGNDLAQRRLAAYVEDLATLLASCG